jgi:hypothetical protein
LVDNMFGFVWRWYLNSLPFFRSTQFLSISLSIFPLSVIPYLLSLILHFLSHKQFHSLTSSFPLFSPTLSW